MWPVAPPCAAQAPAAASGDRPRRGLERVRARAITTATGFACSNTATRGRALQQALIHFQLAHELAPRPENLAMMGHCEYHLGLFKQARDHYEEYLKTRAPVALAETARQRIEAMSRRKGVLVISTVPDGGRRRCSSGSTARTRRCAARRPDEFPVAGRPVAR